MKVLFKFRKLITIISILNLGLFSGCSTSSDGDTSSTDAAQVAGEAPKTEGEITPPPPNNETDVSTPENQAATPAEVPTAAPATEVAADASNNNEANTELENKSSLEVVNDKNEKVAQDSTTDKSFNSVNNATEDKNSSKYEKGGVPPADGKTLLPYYVRAGDTLNSIAKKIFGNSANWRTLAKTNHIQNPNKIFAGDVMYYPLTEKSKAFSKTYESGKRLKVIVKKGDTLSSIASSVYGKSIEWRILWKENPKITNPDKIKAGQVVYYRSLHENNTNNSSEGTSETNK